MKNKQNKQNKQNKIVEAMGMTRGRYMALHLETSKYSQVISCKCLGITDKSVVVQDRNDGNRKRVISKDTLRGIRCDEICVM